MIYAVGTWFRITLCLIVTTSSGSSSSSSSSEDSETAVTLPRAYVSSYTSTGFVVTYEGIPEDIGYIEFDYIAS